MLPTVRQKSSRTTKECESCGLVSKGNSQTSVFMVVSSQKATRGRDNPTLVLWRSGCRRAPRVAFLALDVDLKPWFNGKQCDNISETSIQSTNPNRQ